MIKKIKKEQLFIGVLIGILLLVIAIPVPKEKTEEHIKENELENGGDIHVHLPLA